MKKTLNLLLIISSLLGYLEWGKDQSVFLFRGEWDILKKMFYSPADILHPFILLPMLGQLVLVITLTQKQPNKWLSFFGILCIGLLLGFIFIIGIISLHWKIFLSTLPFVCLAAYTIRYTLKHPNDDTTLE